MSSAVKDIIKASAKTFMPSLDGAIKLENLYKTKPGTGTASCNVRGCLLYVSPQCGSSRRRSFIACLTAPWPDRLGVKLHIRYWQQCGGSGVRCGCAGRGGAGRGGRAGRCPKVSQTSFLASTSIRPFVARRHPGFDDFHPPPVKAGSNHALLEISSSSSTLRGRRKKIRVASKSIISFHTFPGSASSKTMPAIQRSQFFKQGGTYLSWTSKRHPVSCSLRRRFTVRLPTCRCHFLQAHLGPGCSHLALTHRKHSGCHYFQVGKDQFPLTKMS